MVGICLLNDLGLAKLSIKPMIFDGVVLGGLIFGVGWGLLGYCPGTSQGALGEGRWDFIWGIAGMLCGAGPCAETYPTMKATVLTWGDYGKITLPQVFGLSHWLIIPIFNIAGLALFRWFEKKCL